MTRTDDGVLLGLIANNFVRVYHPVDHDATGGSAPGGCANTDSAPGAWCTRRSSRSATRSSRTTGSAGCPLGDLTVDGAIAQKFRGPVGTGSGATITTGFRKNYIYNDRLRYREPPYFLDPVRPPGGSRARPSRCRPSSPSCSGGQEAAQLGGQQLGSADGRAVARGPRARAPRASGIAAA